MFGVCDESECFRLCKQLNNVARNVLQLPRSQNYHFSFQKPPNFHKTNSFYKKLQLALWSALFAEWSLENHQSFSISSFVNPVISIISSMLRFFKISFFAIMSFASFLPFSIPFSIPFSKAESSLLSNSICS